MIKPEFLDYCQVNGCVVAKGKMALVTHQVQGSYASLRPLSWKREIVSISARYPTVTRTNIMLVNHRSCLCLAALPVHGSKWRSLRILSFKGGVQNDDSVGRAGGSRSMKNSVKLPHAPQEGEETLPEKLKVQKIRASAATDTDETIASYLAIHNLFKSWLMLLRTPATPAPNQVMDENLEGPLPSETLETEHRIMVVDSGRGSLLKGAWCYFLALDAKIRIPTVIFIPMYLAVHIRYGAEVAKELTPWWVVGPLIAALYVKTLQYIFSIYASGFNQSVKFAKQLPTYCLVAYDYVAHGKLVELVRGRVLYYSNFKELSERKRKEFDVWLNEKTEEYVESIWPIYFRTIRFLKSVNFI